MKIRLPLIFLYTFLSFSIVTAQEFSISKIEPPNWWVEMEWDTLQLMVYGENLSNVNVKFRDYSMLGSTSTPKILQVYNVNNPSYLFIDVEIPKDIRDGDYELIFNKEDQNIFLRFPVYKREKTLSIHNGFSNEDVIYLIFADRFCDGNTLNNIIGDSLDQFTAEDLDGRKGGDIEGIISKLEYLKELGVTGIWITPMLENDMWMSYHGYAATDLYKIDPRFGSNKLYKQLVEEAHKRGLKIILDHVSNHIGINHYWVKDLPTDDWFNGTPKNFIPASHDKMAFLDMHGDLTVVKMNQQGWFTDYMPDLNQSNPYLKKYLIQNTIWWIEFAGIDGIREDTYPYNDQKYLSEWAKAIITEYPDFSIVGEVWQGDPPVISGYQKNSPVRKLNFDSNLPVVTDFAFSDAVRAYLSGEESIYHFYKTLAQDFVYSDPDNLLVFFDNHDIERAMYVAKGNVEKFKVALNLLLFTRGIPVIFYGTEIGIKGGPKHGELRQPFPGGFTNDERNAFTENERTKEENELYNYLQELLKLRVEYPVLAKGKLRHICQGDIYYLIKDIGNEIALILLNTGEEDVTINDTLINNFLPEVKKVIDLIPILGPVNVNRHQDLILRSFSTNIFVTNNVTRKVWNVPLYENSNP